MEGKPIDTESQFGHTLVELFPHVGVSNTAAAAMEQHRMRYTLTLQPAGQGLRIA